MCIIFITSCALQLHELNTFDSCNCNVQLPAGPQSAHQSPCVFTIYPISRLQHSPGIEMHSWHIIANTNWHPKSTEESWRLDPVVNAHLVDDPTIRQPGFTFPRQQWSLLNRFRTGQGHCRACRRTWHLRTLTCAPIVRPKWCPTSSNPALLPSCKVVCLSFTQLPMQLLLVHQLWILTSHTQEEEEDSKY